MSYKYTLTAAQWQVKTVLKVPQPSLIHEASKDARRQNYLKNPSGIYLERMF